MPSGVGLNAFTSNFLNSYGAVRDWRQQDEDRKQADAERRAVAEAAKLQRESFTTGYQNSGPSAFLGGNYQQSPTQQPQALTTVPAPQQQPAAASGGNSGPGGLPLPPLPGTEKKAPAPTPEPVRALPDTTTPNNATATANAAAADSEAKQYASLAAPAAPTAAAPKAALPGAATPTEASQYAEGNSDVHPLVDTTVKGYKFPTGGMSDTYYQQALRLYDLAAKGGPSADRYLGIANQYAEQANMQRTREFGQTMYGAYVTGGTEGLQSFLNSFGNGTKAKIETITEDGPDKGRLRASWGGSTPQVFSNGEHLVNTLTTMMSGDPDRIAKLVNDNAGNEESHARWAAYRENASAQTEQMGWLRQAQRDEAEARRLGKEQELKEAQQRQAILQRLQVLGRNPENNLEEIQQLATQYSGLDKNAVQYVQFRDPNGNLVTQAQNKIWDQYMSMADHNRGMLLDPRIAKPRADGAAPTIDPQTGRLADATQSMVTIRRRTDKRTGKVESFYFVDGSPKYFETARAAHDEALEIALKRDKPKPTQGALPTNNTTRLPAAEAEFGGG